jgi:hypothetical protein
MSGLFARLDDVAAIAKLAASQLDDIAAHAAKAEAAEHRRDSKRIESPYKVLTRVSATKPD